MQTSKERRRQKRLRFLWPVWFAYQATGELLKGQAVDLNEQGISVTVKTDSSPAVGDHVLARFSFPCQSSQTFAMDGYYGWSEVIRVDAAGPDRQRVALRLHTPLANNPVSESN